MKQSRSIKNMEPINEFPVVTISDLTLIIDALESVGHHVYLVDDNYQVLFLSEDGQRLVVQESATCYKFMFGKDQSCTFCLRNILFGEEQYKYEALEDDASIVKISLKRYLVKLVNGKIVPMNVHVLIPATDEAFLKFQNRLFYSFFGHKLANVLQQAFFWAGLLEMDSAVPDARLDHLEYLKKMLRTLDVLSALTRFRPHQRAVVQESSHGAVTEEVETLVKKLVDDLELLLILLTQQLQVQVEDQVASRHVTRLLRSLLFCIMFDWQYDFKPLVPNEFVISFSPKKDDPNMLEILIRVIHPKIEREQVRELIFHLHPIQHLDQMRFLGTQLAKYLILEMGGNLSVRFSQASSDETLITMELPLEHPSS